MSNIILNFKNYLKIDTLNVNIIIGGDKNMDDVFCKIVKGELPGYVVYETEDIMAIMDAYPHTPGHLLIIPKKHYTTILDLDEEINNKIFNAAKMLMKKMEKLYPHLKSIKVVVNYGEEQVVKHFHMHLLPLYEKDNIPEMSQEEFANLLKSE